MYGSSSTTSAAGHSTDQVHSLGRVAQLAIKVIVRQASNFALILLALTVGNKVGFSLRRSRVCLPFCEARNIRGSKLKEAAKRINEVFH